MKLIIFSITLILLVIGCNKKADSSADETKTSVCKIDVNKACQIANTKAKQKYDVEPFTLNDFHRQDNSTCVVFTAIIPHGYDELKAVVTFKANSDPDVLLSLQTSRLLPIESKPSVLKKEDIDEKKKDILKQYDNSK